MTTLPPYTVMLEPELSEEDSRVLLDGLVTYGERFAPTRDYVSLAVVLRDAQGRVRGGLYGSTIWQWLQIDVLWIEDSLRRQKHGTELMRVAEAHATALGCRYARLDTCEFEARAFYEHLGYVVYAELPDFPIGHRQFHLRKELIGNLSE